MNLILTLAFRNLFHDRVRLIATVVGIVFSIVLVTVQLGVFLSFERMVTTMIDHAQADFWIVPAETKSFEGSSLFAGRERLQALSVNGVDGGDAGRRRLCVVAQAERRRLDAGAGRRRADDRSRFAAWNVVEGSSRICRCPTASRSTGRISSDLGIAQIRGHAEINNQKARVVAVTNGIRSFTTTPQVFTSLERARTYLGVPSNNAPIITSCAWRRTPMPRWCAAGSQAGLTDAEVLTSEEFRHRTRVFWLFDTGAGAALFGSAILGIIVGTIIVAQTLYSSTKDHLKEFATLRAIGSSRLYILKVILSQALISAVVGFSIAAAIDLAHRADDHRCRLAHRHDAGADRRPVRPHGRDVRHRRRFRHPRGDAHRPRAGVRAMTQTMIEATEIAMASARAPRTSTRSRASICRSRAAN